MADKKNPLEIVFARDEYHGFKIEFNELDQRKIEKFREFDNAGKGDKNVPVPHSNHQTVAAAFRAGWFKLPAISVTDTEDPIFDWPPDRVNWLAGKVIAKYSEVMTIDPS